MSRLQSLNSNDINGVRNEGLPYFEQIRPDNSFRYHSFECLNVLCKCSSHKGTIFLEC